MAIPSTIVTPHQAGCSQQTISTALIAAAIADFSFPKVAKPRATGNASDRAASTANFYCPGDILRHACEGDSSDVGNK
jgi:hypothetical protein